MKIFFRSIYFISSITVTVFLLISCKGSDKKADAPAAPKPTAMKVEVYIVKPMMVSDKAELPGSIIANEETEIHPEISGRLVYLNINEGKTVGKGALLAKIYDGDLQAQLKKLQVQLAVAEQTVSRMGELLKINGVSQQEYDLSALQVNTIRADMEIVRTGISRTEIRAPFGGTIGLKNVSAGAYISPATTLTTLRQNSQLKLDFTLPEKYSSSFRIGQSVDFTIEGNPRTYSARIIAAESGVSENTRSLNIRALVNNNDGKLMPGIFAKVATNFNTDPNGLMVPSQSILPQARGKKLVIYRSGIASFTDVVTGLRDSALVQIISGVKQGDTVITTGLMSLKPDAKVSITKINK